ncbi:MAG: metallophosphoesterase [Myxococcales bacterium]|nr:metallophosphoesterase [Myxococcales bacterium]
MRESLRALTASLALLLVGCATSEPSLRLVFYSDVHARTEWETPLALERVRDAINAEQPDLVIATGDLITDGFEAASPAEVSARWDEYLELHHGIEAEVHVAIGNHDLVAANPEDGSPPAADPRAVARERLGLERTYYTFEQSGYRFFLLDSTEVTGGELQYRGFIGEEQLAWLETELASVARETPIVVALHIPLLTSFYSATEGGTFAAPPNRVLVNNREVLALFEQHNLVLVLQGHLHAKELIRWRDTTFITGGAVCGRWWRGAWFGTEPGYNVVTLEGNRVEWDYIEYGWTPRRPRDR